MMAFLKLKLSARSAQKSVAPCGRDLMKEIEVKEALNNLSHAKKNVERRSWEIRRELAGNALRIVSGE